MTIDKSLRQHYAMQGKVRNYLGKQKMVKAPKKWKGAPDHPNTELAYITPEEKNILIKLNLYGSMNGKANKGPSGLPSLQGGGWGSQDKGGMQGGGGGGGGGQDRWEAPAPKTPPKAPPSVLSRPTLPETETVPGDVTFEPVKKYTPPVRHHTIDTKEQIEEQKITDKLNRQNEIRDMIAQQQEEKYGPTADPTKFGETVTPYKKTIDDLPKDESTWTKEDKDIVEDWERSQDWDKIQKLANRGHSSEEIQKAMEKGLLTKADPQSIKTNLLQRGIRSLRNIIPETRLEKSLLGGLKKSFAPTTGGQFDLKKMGLDLARTYAMKKLGLGWLNPWLGLGSLAASLFGFDLSKGFARKPAFDMEEASKLGLYADRYPTATDTLTARDVSTFERDTPTQIALGKKGVFESGRELLGLTGKDDLSDIEGQQAKLQGLALGQMRVLQKKQGMEEFGGEKFTPKDQRMLDKLREMDKEEKVYRTPILTAAHGGRIDKPLMGRRRDI